MKIVFEGNREKVISEIKEFAAFADGQRHRAVAVAVAAPAVAKRRKVGVAKLGRKPYTPSEIALLRTFYNDPANHYENGLVRSKSLELLGRALNRTPMALTVAMQSYGISGKTIHGTEPMRNRRRRKSAPAKPAKRVSVWKTPEFRKAQSERMRKWHEERRRQRLEGTSPQIKEAAQRREETARRKLDDLGVRQELINSGLQYAAANGEFTQMAGIALGIDAEQWRSLCEYVIAHAEAIKAKFGTALKVVREGQQMRIVAA